MPEPQQSDWTFEDLGFFLGAILPSFLVAVLATRPITAESWRAFAFQSLLYVLLLSVLFTLAHIRHQQTLTVALAWNLRFRGAWLYMLLSPILAVAVGTMGELLRSPILPTPIDRLNGIPFPLVMLFAVVAGPLVEEMVFRGFLQTLLARAWGAWPGLLAAAIAFALLHGQEYEWQWQYLLLVFAAGAAFGYARQLTGSTAAAVLLHMGYNMTQMFLSLLH
jgi:membrane protease YdiL (CAAX protease family)